jgi:AraC-like DNA-binding protein
VVVLKVNIRKPHPQLASFATTAGMASQGLGDVAGLHYRQLPNVIAKVFFFTASIGVPAGILAAVGPHRHLVNANPFWRDMVWLALRPGTLGLLCGAAGFYLRDNVIRLEEAWGRDFTARLANKIFKSRKNSGRLKLLEKAVLEKTGKDPRPHPLVTAAVGRIELSGGRIRVAGLASELGRPLATLVRAFRTHLGLSPKQYCQVRRVRGILDQMRSGIKPRLAHLALDHGYFDQSHANHDFRALMGMTPREFQHELASDHFRFDDRLDVLIKPSDPPGPVISPEMAWRVKKMLPQWRQPGK